MTLNIKDLKKLADTCRKAGIKHFKSAEFEFTLTDDLPVSKSRKVKAKEAISDNTPIESDTLTDEDLLFWSVREDTDSEQKTQ